ncbi:hypothetical protein TTHERM_00600810 (macronuclear) [Tetrahymena thermophila SB210]|uniref:Uncharacterized protein n=1 Tax=Tetrahymena thermophila (strain SB210) TaxID=312017 RepID=I7LTA4_TETTS|nr:hypothetical protein TTHERM_00600810 [Tetrahymena thermophila SB210]EAR84889.1 hypothetical protein TTHERM_00600810 [Tetrahymena thermophila SB210]|eukprot:XP_001032552.1 hypothetical protein TTHERM_00600810 [Tetrahymena thermophila SB210]
MGSSAGKNNNSDKKLVSDRDANQKNILKSQNINQNSDSQWDDVHGNFILPQKMELKKQCIETQQQVDEALKRLIELNIIPNDSNTKKSIRQRYPQKHYSYHQQPIKGIQSERILKKKTNQDDKNQVKFFGPDQIVRRNNSKPSLQCFTQLHNSPQHQKENICQNYKNNNQLKQERMNIYCSPSRNYQQEKGFLPQINQNKNQIQRCESMSYIIKT